MVGSRPVLITGVGGFLGRRLGSLLIERGHGVVGTVLAGEAPALPGIDLETLDICDAVAVKDLVDRVDPATIVHLAALSHVGSSWTRMGEHFQTNVLGTEAVVDAAAGRRVLLASSAEVYGAVQSADLPIREELPLAPANPYAFGKACAERLVLRGGGVVVRCFNVVGAGQAPSFALPTFARQLVAIRRGLVPPVLRVGNLEAVRDFVHVDDAIAGLALALDRGVAGEAYNLASGEPRRLRDLVLRMIEIAGLEVEIEVDKERLRPAEAPWLQGQPARLEALGWSRHKDLDEALRDLLVEAEQLAATEERANGAGGVC